MLNSSEIHCPCDLFYVIINLAAAAEAGFYELKSYETTCKPATRSQPIIDGSIGEPYIMIQTVVQIPWLLTSESEKATASNCCWRTGSPGTPVSSNSVTENHD